MQRRAHTCLLLLLLSQGLSGCTALARKAARIIAEDPVALNIVLEASMREATQLGHLRLTTGFYLVIHHLVSGDEDLNDDEQVLARLVISHFLGESFGHALLPRIQGEPLIYGEGEITFTGYYHSEGQEKKGALIDANGSFLLGLPDGERLEKLNFNMRSLNQLKELKPGDVPQRFEILPMHSSYEPENLGTRRWKDTVFHLATLLREHKREGKPVVTEFARYLPKRGPLGPILTIEYRLHDLVDGCYSYSLSDEYPVYLRLDSELISAKPEYQRAVEALERRGTNRVRRSEDGIEVLLGFAATIPYSTGYTETVIGPAEIEKLKRFRMPAFPAAEPVGRKQ